LRKGARSHKNHIRRTKLSKVKREKGVPQFGTSVGEEEGKGGWGDEVGGIVSLTLVRREFHKLKTEVGGISHKERYKVGQGEWRRLS